MNILVVRDREKPEEHDEIAQGVQERQVVERA